MKPLDISTTDRLEELEERVTEQAKKAMVNPLIWTKFMLRIAPLKRHNERMYQHSLRVGLYANGLAMAEDCGDIKLPLFGGCGHDMGKCFVPNAILDATKLAENSPEFDIIRTHADIGFQLLKADFPYTAIIAGLHHSFQSHSYGIDIAESPIPLSQKSKQTLDESARLVAISDFFDAITTRKNDKGLISDPSDKKELTAVLIKHFPTSISRIEWLMANQI